MLALGRLLSAQGTIPVAMGDGAIRLVCGVDTGNGPLEIACADTDALETALSSLGYACEAGCWINPQGVPVRVLGGLASDLSCVDVLQYEDGEIHVSGAEDLLISLLMRFRDAGSETVDDRARLLWLAVQPEWDLEYLRDRCEDEQVLPWLQQLEVTR